MASATASSDVTDGPVLTLINKRIRNLKKKLNRISQLEDSINQGKSAIKNKEQEELLKSKPSIVAAVDELEKFRQPLSIAVDEEITLAVKRFQSGASVNNTTDVSSGNGGVTETITETLGNGGETETVTVTDAETVTETLGTEDDVVVTPAEAIEDLLKLIYFGSMFDVKSQSDFNSIMLTKTHERNCCLTYDYVFHPTEATLKNLSRFTIHDCRDCGILFATMATGAVPASFMTLKGRGNGLELAKTSDFVKVSDPSNQWVRTD